MPAGRTYEMISSTTLGSVQSEVILQNFSGYTDLVVVFSTRNSIAIENLIVRFNNDSGNNYSLLELATDGNSSVGGYTQQARGDVNLYGMAMSAATDALGLIVFNVMSYADTEKFKVWFATQQSPIKADGTTGYAIMRSGVWYNTNAITSIYCYAGNSGNFQIGSVFSVYGIKSA